MADKEKNIIINKIPGGPSCRHFEYNYYVNQKWGTWKMEQGHWLNQKQVNNKWLSWAIDCTELVFHILDH